MADQLNEQELRLLQAIAILDGPTGGMVTCQKLCEETGHAQTDCLRVLNGLETKDLINGINHGKDGDIYFLTAQGQRVITAFHTPFQIANGAPDLPDALKPVTEYLAPVTTVRKEHATATAIPNSETKNTSSKSDIETPFRLLKALFDIVRKPTLPIKISKVNEQLKLNSEVLAFNLARLSNDGFIVDPLNDITSVTEEGAQHLFTEFERRKVKLSLRKGEDTLKFLEELLRLTDAGKRQTDGDILLADLGLDMNKVKDFDLVYRNCIIAHDGPLPAFSKMPDTLGYITSDSNTSVIVGFIRSEVGKLQKRLAELNIEQERRQQEQKNIKSKGQFQQNIFNAPVIGGAFGQNSHVGPVTATIGSMGDGGHAETIASRLEPKSKQRRWFGKIPKRLKVATAIILAITGFCLACIVSYQKIMKAVSPATTTEKATPNSP